MARARWDAEHVCATCEARPARKIFWLSFCDSSRPEGSQFLGACVIEVTREEAEDALIEVALRFSFAQGGAEWIAAAVRKAHELHCNPGGEVATMEIPPDHPMLNFYARGILMDKATIARLDDEIDRAAH